MKELHSYLDQCLNDKIPAGRLYKLAIERYFNDLNRKDLVFKKDKYERICKYIEKLARHYKGRQSGKAIELAQFQRFYLANIYGFYFANTDIRRFYRSYLEIGRKNGKTTLLSLQGQFHIAKEVPEGAQVYVISTKEDQSKICTTDAANIINRSPLLKPHFKTFKVRERYSGISYIGEGMSGSSFMKALGRDSKSLDGLHASMMIGDETHAWAYGVNDELEKVVEDSGQGRENFLNCRITTAGFNKYGYGYEIHTTNKKILKGAYEDDRSFAQIHALDEGDDWNDIELYGKASPGLTEGILNYEQDIKKAHTDAQNGGFDQQNFKTKYLNMWVDSPSVFLSTEQVKACNHYPISLQDFKDREVYIGVDLGKTEDLNAIAIVSYNDRTQKLDCIVKYWMPSAKITGRKDNVDYRKWIEAGWIDTTPGNVIEYRVMEQWMQELGRNFNVAGFGYDGFMFEAAMSTNDLNVNGYEAERMHKISQGPQTKDPPIRELQRLVIGQEINFDNPVLTWNFSNLNITTNSGGLLVMDKKDRTRKVDGVDALIDALLVYQLYHREEKNQLWVI